MALPKGTTTSEILTVNGVILNTLAKNIESLTGRLRTPSKRTGNIRVPGRHGSLRTANKMYDENLIVLPMWVLGCTDDGKIPSGSNARKEFFKRVDELSALFIGATEPLDVRHTLPDGTIRQCFADVMDAIDFTTEAAVPVGKFGVSLVLAEPFWRDLNEVSEQQEANGATAQFFEFEGSSAPLEDLVATVMGPWNNPRLTFSDGSWVQYNDTFSGTQGVIIDSGDWSVTGVGGKVVQLNKLTYSGGTSRWMSIPAPGPAPLEVGLTGSARTTATRLTLTGHRKFLVG